MILPSELGYNHLVMPKAKPTVLSTDSAPRETAVWSIKLFYSEAIQLLKRRREIWILVILVVIFAGGSSNGLRSLGNGSSSSDSSKSKIEKTDSTLPMGSEKATDYSLSLDQDKDFEKIQTEEKTHSKKSQASTSTPEGAAVATDLATLTEQPDHFFDLLKQIGLGWYVLLGVNLLVLLVWSLLFSFIAAAWVKASLIWAVYRESQLKPWQLADAVKAGSKVIASFIWLQLVPAFAAVVVFILGTLGVGLMIGLLAVIAKTSPWAVIAIAALGTAYLAIVLYAAFKLTVIHEIAQRLVVAQAMPAYDAFKQAFQWAKGMTRKFFRLAASEALLQVGAVFVAIVPIVIMAVVMAGMPNHLDSNVMGLALILMSILFVVVGVILLIVIFSLGIAARGLHVALWQMAWNYLASVKNSAVKVQNA